MMTHADLSFCWGIGILLVVSFRPNKKISVFWVTGMEIIGRVGTHIFLSPDEVGGI